MRCLISDFGSSSSPRMLHLGRMLSVQLSASFTKPYEALHFPV